MEKRDLRLIIGEIIALTAGSIMVSIIYKKFHSIPLSILGGIGFFIVLSVRELMIFNGVHVQVGPSRKELLDEIEGSKDKEYKDIFE